MGIKVNELVAIGGIDELTTDIETLRTLVDDPLAPPIRVARERQQLLQLEDAVTQHNRCEGDDHES